MQITYAKYSKKFDNTVNSYNNALFGMEINSEHKGKDTLGGAFYGNFETTASHFKAKIKQYIFGGKSWN